MKNYGYEEPDPPQLPWYTLLALTLGVVVAGLAFGVGVTCLLTEVLR